MDQQPMNLRRAAKVTKRYKSLIGLIALVGLVAGAGYALIDPPKLTSQALLVLPQPSPNIATQVLIAGSAPVFTGALPALGDGVTLQSLEKKITVSQITPNAISVTAKDNSAKLAEQEANAVATSYVSYVTSSRSPFASVVAHVLVYATSAAGMTLADGILLDAAIGLLAGLLIGLIVAAWRDRSVVLLWERDQIAQVAGAPVIAALAASSSAGQQRRLGQLTRFVKPRRGVGSPQAQAPVSGRGDSAAGWVRFFRDFDPLVGSAWQLRTVLDRLAAAGTSSTVTVLSVSADKKALALGPVLAAFAAKTGRRTALVVGPQQAPGAVPGLRAAAAASGEPDNPQILAADPAGNDWSTQDAELNVIVVTVDGGSPAVPEEAGAAPTVLAVTAGGVSAADLARVAAAVRRTGSRIAGVIVGDPEAGDGTTGRAPRQDGQAARAAAGGDAVRVNGRVTEMR